MHAHKALKARHREIRDDQPEHLRIRIHRALSWLKRAEDETSDPDLQFILLGVALNAAYAREFGLDEKERDRAHVFMREIAALDATDRRIHGGLFERFSGPIRTLIENKFTFHPYWKALREHDSSERWKQRFDAERKAAVRSLLNNDTAAVLVALFDRLYVLRNQLVHGGATWNGDTNRQQVRDGAAILSFLVPLVLGLMMDHPELELGDVLYPVVR